jgi:2'-hydroxyisoflavone reductase
MSARKRRPTRRELLAYTAGCGLWAAGLACGGARQKTSAQKSAGATRSRPRSLLILGGTGFLGPAIVESARARGHTLTLFNRGRTNPTLFPDVEKLRGDRDGKLDALRGRRWDAVVDTSGYVPRVVKMSADLLAHATSHYVFISTISVYASLGTAGSDESAAVIRVPEPIDEKKAKENYGGLKALCEQAAEASMPGRVTNIRPGLIAGPRDPSGRFTYWPVRVARAGEILAPGTGADPVQYVDVRDLAEWIVHVIENSTMGVYNALGPASPLAMKELLAQVAAGVGAIAPTFTWIPADFLEKVAVQPWSDMPVWVPAVGEYLGAASISNARAKAAGLRFRSPARSAADTLAWYRSLDESTQRKVSGAGLDASREQDVLARWRASGRAQRAVSVRL